ncbi:transglycosylase domain-containing protein [Kluyvera intermedia]|uniref:transglycosylase domain-containing protein n=1 Tax=Kluyvera intermedia TaxID=61648 RepID=UPI0039C04FD5
MQMVRTLTDFRDLSIFRKIYEIILSILVNYKFTKKQIIRCYLTRAFFGSGLYGFETASIKCFGKDFSELTSEQQAFLAAMLLRPKPMKPNEKWTESVTIRASYAQKVRVFVKDSNE